MSLAKSLTCIYILTMLQKNAAAAIVYNQLMQEFARRSAHFCEKACTGGLIHLLLVNLQHFVIVSAPEVSRCKFAFKVLIFNLPPSPIFGCLYQPQCWVRRVYYDMDRMCKGNYVVVFLNKNSNMTLWQLWQDWKLAARRISRLFPNVNIFFLEDIYYPLLCSAFVVCIKYLGEVEQVPHNHFVMFAMFVLYVRMFCIFRFC